MTKIKDGGMPPTCTIHGRSTIATEASDRHGDARLIFSHQTLIDHLLGCLHLQASVFEHDSCHDCAALHIVFALALLTCVDKV